VATPSPGAPGKSVSLSMLMKRTPPTVKLYHMLSAPAPVGMRKRWLYAEKLAKAASRGPSKMHAGEWHSAS
jgi:hypothetical protein